jgi:hypothetical protein
MSEAVWKDVSGEIAAEPRNLLLEGSAEPVNAFVAGVMRE